MGKLNYGAGLMVARQRAGLSKRRLAMNAGYDPSYITHIENGSKKPSLEALECLAAACGCKVSAILLEAER